MVAAIGHHSEHLPLPVLAKADRADSIPALGCRERKLRVRADGSMVESRGLTAAPALAAVPIVILGDEDYTRGGHDSISGNGARVEGSAPGLAAAADVGGEEEGGEEDEQAEGDGDGEGKGERGEEGGGGGGGRGGAVRGGVSGHSCGGKGVGPEWLPHCGEEVETAESVGPF